MSAYLAVLPILAEATASRPAPSMLETMMPLLFLAIIFFFVIIRPQQRRAKEQAAIVAGLKTGDKVVTSSGFHGMVANVKEKTVIVKFAENVKIEVDKSSVVAVAKPGGETESKSTPLPAKTT
jgi:preprotein translocase subunit YajC